MINALVPYYGGKRTLAPELVRQFGDHRAYWSLFGGSLADLLVKPVSEHEYVNDLYGDLVNLTMVIAGPRWAELLGKVRRARVVVSYYDHPELLRLYPGWTRVDVAQTKQLALSNQRDSTATEASEVLLINGPAYGQQGSLF